MIEGRYLHTLEHYVSKKQDKNQRIINLGCGPCYEAETLVDLFNGSLIGLDIDKNSINALRRKFKGRDDYKFIKGDAKDLRILVEGNFGIVVARHPDVNNDDWEKIFREGYKFTRRGGTVIVTCYLPKEPEIAKKNMEHAGYNIKVCEENVLPLIKAPLPIWSDSYVIIGKK